MNYALIIPIAVAVIAALGTYLVARRKSSGQIATSEASTLWSQAQEMRKELRDEIVKLRTDLTTEQGENADCRKQLNKLRVDMNQTKAKVRKLEAKL